MDICKICQKDHTKKNEGPLSECEEKEYWMMGAPSNHKDSNGAVIYAFGTGNRFQFRGAR
jgi:hypothetical protein